MKFQAACDVRLGFGQRKGQTIADIGVTGDGLLYLDWLRHRSTTPLEVVTALETYFENLAIRDELNELLGRTAK